MSSTTRNKKRSSQRSSPHRGKKRLCYESTEEFPCTNIDENTQNTNKLTNKQIVSKIFDLLNISKENAVEHLPNKGFTEESIAKNSKSLQRANRIVLKAVHRLCELVCPSNSEFKSQFVPFNKSDDNEIEKIQSNMAEIIFFGKRMSRIVAQSVLATSF